MLRFKRGDKVAKVHGQVRYEGTICTSYYTFDDKGEDNYLRYVVQIYPQGFQYIANEEQLEPIKEFSHAL